MKNNTLAIALASLLVGGVAVAAFQNGRSDSDLAGDAALVDDGAIPSEGRLEYAQVVQVDPLTEQRELFATVIGSEAIRETTTSSSPRQVCEDVVIEQSAPVKDPNRITGTVAGAVIGGLIGNQVGGGDGRKVATAAGAVGGAYAGRHIQARQQQNRTVQTVDRQCRTVSDTSQSSRVVGYNVTYRNPDGTTGTMRTDAKPGDEIRLGNEDVTIGYDVTYRYDGSERTIRMDEKPGTRLPVIDGQVVTQVAAMDGNERG